MNKKEFDRILIEEGILSKRLRNDLWTIKPPLESTLTEKRLRKRARWFKKNHL